jgi:hypothetical protein
LREKPLSFKWQNENVQTGQTSHGMLLLAYTASLRERTGGLYVRHHYGT